MITVEKTSLATPSWILNATERIVERCSTVDDRVLILAAFLPERKGTRGICSNDEEARRRGRRMLPLMEIAAVGARLGRRVEVRLHDQSGSGPTDAPTGPHHETHPAPAPRTPDHPGTDRQAAPGLSAARSHAPSNHSDVPSSDPATETANRFDLVIVIADSPAPAAMPTITWSHVLNDSGVLAFITHGYDPGRRPGHLGTAIRHSTAAAGLVQFARVPLLEVPVQHSALSPEQAIRLADHDGPPWPRRHTDLFLFTTPCTNQARETGAGR